MSEKYYIRAFGKVEGPYTIGKLQRMRQNGQFSSAYEVSTDQEQWLSAEVVIDKMRTKEPIKSSRPVAEVPVDDSPKQDDEPRMVRRETPLRQIGSSAKRDWYYSNNGLRSKTSVTWQSISDMVVAGELKLKDFVIETGSDSWIRVGEHPELRLLSPHAASAEGNAKAWVGAVGGVISTLLAAVVMIVFVTRLRQAGFPPSQNLIVLCGWGLALIFAVAATLLGHLNLAKYHGNEIPSGIAKLIIVSMSCGYTSLITETIIAIVFVVHLMNPPGT